MQIDLGHPGIVAAIVSAIGAIGVASIGLIGAVLKIVAGINRAVNHRGPGEDTLYELVYKTKATQEIHGKRLDRIEGTLESVEDRTKELVVWKNGYEGNELSTGEKARNWFDEDKSWKKGTDDRLDDIEREEEIDRQRIADLERESKKK